MIDLQHTLKHLIDGIGGRISGESVRINETEWQRDGHFDAFGFFKHLSFLPEPWPARGPAKQYVAVLIGLRRAGIIGQYPIQLGVIEGPIGRVYKIRDYSSGFDVYSRNNLEPLLTRELLLLENTPNIVSFSDKGNECFVQVLYSNGGLILP